MSSSSVHMVIIAAASKLSAAAAAGALVTYLVLKRRIESGKSDFAKINQDVQKNLNSQDSQTFPDVETSSSEVIFFPDRRLDVDASRAAKVLRYREILDGSRPFERLLGHLSGAERSVDVCLFLVTSHQLAEAVLEGIGRGVKVRLILDDSSIDFTGSQANKFGHGCQLAAIAIFNRVLAFKKLEIQHFSCESLRGAHVRTIQTPFKMHHKFAIVDGRKLVTGSFNWTLHAVMGNKENVIVTEHPDIVKEFVGEFERLWSETGLGKKDQMQAF